MRLTHASFFSGVGGLDLGFERAGITTTSLCEIDPYASAVLATHWPDIINHGDIVALAEKELGNGKEGDHQFSAKVQQTADKVQRSGGPVDNQGRATSSDDWKRADIWSGGFPCQDLSVAGKRAGFSGSRSSLAFTFLDLVERFHPRWIVLENVPGLFTSNGGRDFLRLLSEVDELGYGVSWRTLDARYFGVPQRRRRVFIVASLGDDSAREVLFECEGGCGHSATSRSSWQESPTEAGRSLEVAGAILSRYHKGATSTVETGQLIVSAPPHASGVRASDGLAGRVDNRNGMEAEPQSKEGIEAYRKSRRAQSTEDYETWVNDSVANTLNLFDSSGVRTTHAVVGGAQSESTLLPDRLDSHRYRCCGNGVVANVAEWIGRRILAVHERTTV
jgi:DNA-cytosine methyltransferase